MASPQTERGFVMIACDLFAALSVADWPKREWTVLAEILLQVYGPQKRREAHVDPRQIEHYTALSAKNVYRALKNLRACGVIAETKTGSFRFIKDFESWDYEMVEKVTKNPVRSRRLTDGDLRFALSANDRYGVVLPIKQSKSVGIQRDTDGIQLDTASGSERYPTGYHSGAPTVSNGILPSGKETAKVDGLNQAVETTCEQTLAYKGARASEEFKNLDRLASQAGGRAGEDDSAPMTVDELLLRVEAEFQRPAITAEVRANLGSIMEKLGDRLDCFFAGLCQAKRSRSKIRSLIGFAIHEGETYKRTGIPPEPLAYEPERSVRPPADRATPAPDPAKAASKSCEHCSGEGVVTVYHPAPDPARRIPATTPADCVCAWGRVVRSKRSAEDAARIPDLEDVLARRCAWLADRP